MTQKIVAIIGTYRKDGITDQTVDAVLGGAREKGAQTEKIYLTDKHIEFCTNCRTCCKTDPAQKRGHCVHSDDMDGLLDNLDAADGIVLASPINFYTVTAVMKRFVERLTVYSYWPWEQPIPKSRITRMNKKAVIVTSSACPAFIGRLLMPNARQILKVSAEVIGAKVAKSVYFGGIATKEKQKLNDRQIKSARDAGLKLL